MDTLTTAACPRLPSRAPFLARRLPFRIARFIGEPVINRVFADALADDALQMLETRELALHICDLDLSFGFRIVNGRILMRKPEKPMASISGPLAAFIWLASREADADTLFFHRHLTMEGDTELALAVKNTIDATDLSALPAALHSALALAVRLVPAQAPGVPDTDMPGSPNQ